MQSSMRRMGLLLLLQPSRASVSVSHSGEALLLAARSGANLVLVHSLLKGEELVKMGRVYLATEAASFLVWSGTPCGLPVVTVHKQG